MKELVNRIRTEGRNLGDGILKVPFLNHQIAPRLLGDIGYEFSWHFNKLRLSSFDKVFTAEVSGIPSALAVGMAYGVPLVYARKQMSITTGDDCFVSAVSSPTKGGKTLLYLSPEDIEAGDRVLIIDDFLASGNTIEALSWLVKYANAELVGIGVVIEKSFMNGREELESLGVPIVSLAVVESMNDDEIVVTEGRSV